MTDRSIAIDPSAVAASDASVGDYFALLKPRVMSLVVFTGFTGLYLAPGALHPVLALTAVLCIALGAGAAGAINMWYDRDIVSEFHQGSRTFAPAKEPPEPLHLSRRRRGE